MAFLQDHILSIIIGGLVMLAMMQVYLDGQRAGIEITTLYSGRTSTLSFVETLQHDFPNIGSRMSAADPMILNYVWNSTTKFIEFRGTIDTLDAAPVEQIKYQVVFSDSMQIEFNGTSEMVALYEVQRLVDDAGTYKITGSSAPTVREFEISLFDGSGLPVTATWDNTRQVEIRMVAVPPLSDSQVIRHNYWQTRFRPPSLALKNP